MGPSNKAIGCMSGILQLLSRHHSRRRIPSAPIKEKIEAPPAASTLALPKPEFAQMTTVSTPKNGDAKLSAGGGGLANRSPTLPSEIRRSGGCFDLEDSPQRQPALVARLMGLERPTPLQPPAAVSFSADSAEEKRRKLLGALERCDEDLRALKRIIDAVRTAEMHRLKSGRVPPATPEAQCLDGNGEQPSPVSVLDPPSSPKSGSSENAESVPSARSLVPVFSEAGQELRKDCSSVEASRPLIRRMTPDRISRSMAERKGIKNPADPAIPVGLGVKGTACGRWQWRWRESETKVREEGAAFEEERVVAGVLMELADGVAGDLVDGLVMELVECWYMPSLVQRGRCKRKLYL